MKNNDYDMTMKSMKSQYDLNACSEGKRRYWLMVIMKEDDMIEVCDMMTDKLKETMMIVNITVMEGNDQWYYVLTCMARGVAWHRVRHGSAVAANRGGVWNDNNEVWWEIVRDTIRRQSETWISVVNEWKILFSYYRRSCDMDIDANM